MHPPALRPAAPADAPALAALAREAYAVYVARIGREPGPMVDDYAARVAGDIVHVVEDAAGIVGLVVLIEKPDGILLDNVAVAPRAQGRGLGRVLIDFAEAETVRRGYTHLDLYTHVLVVSNFALSRESLLFACPKRSRQEKGHPDSAADGQTSSGHRYDLRFSVEAGLARVDFLSPLARTGHPCPAPCGPCPLRPAMLGGSRRGPPRNTCCALLRLSRVPSRLGVCGRTPPGRPRYRGSICEPGTHPSAPPGMSASRPGCRAVAPHWVCMSFR